MLQLERVRLVNVRCFEQLDIRLADPGEFSGWTLVLGDNATGKSTSLRSNAMGLCDEESAAGLLKESGEGYVRRGASKESDNTLATRHQRQTHETTTRLSQVSRYFAAIDAESGKRLAEDAVLARKTEILMLIPAVSNVTAAALLSLMPELGRVDAKTVASLAGHVEAVVLATLEWVNWFNCRHLLAPIGYVPPVECEQHYYRSQTSPVMLAGVT